ncbi:hypothetical protein [Flexivirga meconopsidis]|uniref:hypothetical protein n=1 Tax=Flexivirga meconopsidis TaxID=2977121 RepID=UPI00223F1867|nr:hypothetical protein [Flexivirga meconopsidis]
MNALHLAVPSLAAAALLAGCSSSGSATVETPSGAGSATTSATSSAPSSGEQPSSGTTSTTPSSEPSASSSSADAGSSTAAGGLGNGLLTPADLGTGYTGGPRPVTDGTPMPCTPSKPALGKQVPADEDAAAEFANKTEQLQLSESLKEYADEASAKRAFTAAVDGFSCSSGKLSDTTIRIVTKPAAAGTAADELKAWDFGDGKTVKGTIVAGRVGNRFVGLTFAVPATKDASAIDLSTIVNKALTRAKQS